MVQPVYEEITISAGVDWYHMRALAYEDGTLKNLAGWTGAWNVYTFDDYSGTPILSSDDNAVLQLGLAGIELTSTTLASAATAGATTVTVASATGISIGDTLTVTMTAVAILEATVTGIAGTTLTLSVPLTDDAASGATVQAWDSRYALCNVLVYVDDAVTTALAGWGRGTYDLTLTDPFGHEDRYFAGPACWQEGTR